MEYDRFEHHPILFVMGLLSLMIGLLMVVFCIYLLPHIFFSWDYSLPLTWYQWSQLIQNKYVLSLETAEKWFFMSLLILSFVLLFIAEWISNYIDSRELKVKVMKEELDVSLDPLQQRGEGWRIFLLVALILLITIFGVRLLEWSITLSTSP